MFFFGEDDFSFLHNNYRDRSDDDDESDASSIPLKSGLFDDTSIFNGCKRLVQVDLVGSIHRVVSSLHFEEWRLQMTDAINQNQSRPSF